MSHMFVTKFYVNVLTVFYMKIDYLGKTYIIFQQHGKIGQILITESLH